jgi:hypothetical protein
MPIRRGFLALLSTALLAATPSLAHNGEFILAKAAPTPGGGLLLEVTADYGNNPLFSTEEQAREAIRSCLQIESRGNLLPLESIAPFAFEKHSTPDPDCPLPKTETAADEIHWLLTGRWHAQPDSEQALFSSPKQSPHSVILWTPPAPNTPTRWAMLLGGDKAPPISLTKAQRPLHTVRTLAGITCLVLCVAATAGILSKSRTLRTSSNPLN